MAPAGAAPAAEVGGYRLEGLIGQGALGQVFRARDPAGRPVALKLLALADAGGEAERRFAAEAAIARRLVHPDIVRVFDAGEAPGGRGWIAMELLLGCDLGRYTRPARLLPEAVVLGVGERIAGALAYAHGRGVVHRDVKPSNVVVDWAARRVTLTDFGIASVAGAERTRTGLVLGTPAYMAPELLAGAAPTPATDLYALGVLLFELLSGRLPHEGTTLGELLRSVAVAAAPDVRSLAPQVPAPAAEAVARLLAKAAHERPSGAAEAASGLAQARAALESPPGPKSRA
jgi:eukaryotic-like serine/threonine-protein kinase